MLHKGSLFGLILGLLAPIACQSSVPRDSPPSPADHVEAQGQPEPSHEPPPSASSADGDDQETRYQTSRELMIANQIAARGIDDERVLAALRAVPRHKYVPEPMRAHAYEDRPLPIGHDQTISQPFIVAFMTQALEVAPSARVLEIGTGSGYQAAVLGELASEVFSIEIICELAKTAKAALEDANYDNIEVRCGDGYKGWPEKAPFDAIIVTAAPPEIPAALIEQLRPGGRMIVPVGVGVQSLQILTKNEDGTLSIADILPVRFVPMVPGQEE